MPLIEKRYAEALVGIAAKNGLLDDYQQELQTIVSLFNAQQDFKFLMLNPEVKTNVKKEFINTVFGNKASHELVNFLMILLDKGRVKFLPGILEEFIKLADKMKNVLSMTIVSTVPLEELQIKKIKEKYRKMYNAVSVKAEIEIDKSLVGGVKVIIGDKVIDGTITGRLESLKELLAGNLA